MTLRQRITIFVALWIIAGVLCAVFSEVIVEAGESEFFARLQLVYLVPLVSASGVAFTLINGHYDTWQQRDLYEAVIGWMLVAAFGLHAMIALTRETWRQFMALTAIQILFLTVSVGCVLYYIHYDNTHSHG